MLLPSELQGPAESHDQALLLQHIELGVPDSLPWTDALSIE